mmetsp:Transcript_4535/g.13260  ORF Transcript_4535/g.13260 Transcript_4535/m.13260 type:complete len:254 (-) Transcript_4535:554-1315(-)
MENGPLQDAREAVSALLLLGGAHVGWHVGRERPRTAVARPVVTVLAVVDFAVTRVVDVEGLLDRRADNHAAALDRPREYRRVVRKLDGDSGRRESRSQGIITIGEPGQDRLVGQIPRGGVGNVAGGGAGDPDVGVVPVDGVVEAQTAIAVSHHLKAVLERSTRAILVGVYSVRIDRRLLPDVEIGVLEGRVLAAEHLLFSAIVVEQRDAQAHARNAREHRPGAPGNGDLPRELDVILRKVVRGRQCEGGEVHA